MLTERGEAEEGADSDKTPEQSRGGRGPNTWGGSSDPKPAWGAETKWLFSCRPQGQAPEESSLTA